MLTFMPPGKPPHAGTMMARGSDLNGFSRAQSACVLYLPRGLVWRGSERFSGTAEGQVLP